MVMVDTSVWIDVLRDETGVRKARLTASVGDKDMVLSRFTEMELLQGCRDEGEWDLLAPVLATQDYVELRASTWRDAARIYFDLRRLGRTVRSPIDCCIAQLALDSDTLLLHRDRDFETVSTIRPLRHVWLDW
jgi:predicted nucleic acid-binding protein